MNEKSNLALDNYIKYFLSSEQNLNKKRNVGDFEKNLKNSIDNFVFLKEVFKEKNPNGIKSIYFIESHIINEGKNMNEIEIDVSKKKYQYINEIKKIKTEELKVEGKEYSINVYRINLNIELVPNKQITKSEDNYKTVEIIINLKQNKSEFNSKKIINIEKNNFLGKINFEEITSFLIFKYTPPETIELSDFQIVKLFHESLLKEKEITTEEIYLEFLDYAINLFEVKDNYKLEFYILLYTNIINRHNYSLIKKIFDLFELKKITEENENSALLKYELILDSLYKYQDYIMNKINYIIKNKITENNLEYYLFKFYTIYIYFLNFLNLNEKLDQFLKDLRDNNYDKLILPKLYLSKYSSFYRSISISSELKKSLINKFFEASKSYDDLQESFSLISEYLNRDFVSILLVIKNNYNKIYEICSNNKKIIEIEKYINQSDKDDWSKMMEYLDFILDKKKENKFEPVNFDVNLFIFYIKNSFHSKLLSFIESKLFEVLITFKDIKDALIYSSTLKNKKFIVFLEIIIKNIEKIKKICKNENRYIQLDNRYIKGNEDDDLLIIKNLIQKIVSIEKKENYCFIQFKTEIWESYIKTKDLDRLKLIKKIIEICKEIDEDIDIESISLGSKIHKLGIELIKKGELTGEKLLLFLGEDETFYTNKKIKTLENENDRLTRKINKLENEVDSLSYENSNLRDKYESLKSRNSNLESKMNDLEKEFEKLKNKVNSLNYNNND